jgi:ABC-type protease/lipase transport system fused ATPase/permease subunit
MERALLGVPTAKTSSFLLRRGRLRLLSWRWTMLLGKMLALSGLLTLLQLLATFYVLAVYDQALPSRSLTTLAALTGLMLGLHTLFAVLDVMRSRLMLRASLALVRTLDRRIIATSRGGGIGDAASFGDVERVGRFLCSAGPAAFFDVLWLPAFIASVSFLHPALGVFAVSGVVLLIGVSFVAEARSREPGKKLGRVRLERYALHRELDATGCLRGDGAAGPDFARRWRRSSRGYFDLLGQSQERAHALSALGKSLRAIMQSAGLGLGALLAIEGAISAGALVASSVLVGRTFACLDAALAHWPNFVAARDSSTRLTARAPYRDNRSRS